MSRLSRFLKKRPVILHYHIFKNAGTTLDNALEHSFQAGFRDIHTDLPAGVVSQEELIRFVKSDRSIKVVTSHHIRLPVPRAFRIRFLPFLIVRQPVDRMVSIYEFERRQSNPAAYPIRGIAMNSTLEEFIGRAIRVAPRVCCDTQVNFFARGGDYVRPPDERDFEKACMVARGLPFVGVIERLDETMVVAEHLYGRKIRGLNLAYVPQNVTPGRANSLPARMTELEQAVGREACQHANDANKLDIRFHHYCSDLLSKVIRQVPGFSEKLKEFQARCESRSALNEQILRGIAARKEHEKAG